MNRNQRFVGITCTIALVAMLIYPPFATHLWPGVKVGKGYSFIWSPPSIPSNEFLQKPIPTGGKTFHNQKPQISAVLEKPVDKASIDVSTLLSQILIIVAVRVLAIYALKDREN